MSDDILDRVRDPMVCTDELHRELAEEVKQLRETVSEMLTENNRLDAELDGARETIRHQCEAASWIAGHDRQGLDHLEDAMAAAKERDAAEAEVRRLREQIEELRAAGPWTTHVETCLAMQRTRDGDCVCDLNPATTDGPQEHCPHHGRPYGYWVEGTEQLAAENTQLRKQLEAAQQAADHWRGLWGDNIEVAQRAIAERDAAIAEADTAWSDATAKCLEANSGLRADLDRTTLDAARLRAKLDRLRLLTEASDDGTQWSHVDGCEGEPSCPACWAAAIRKAVADD